MKTRLAKLLPIFCLLLFAASSNLHASSASVYEASKAFQNFKETAASNVVDGLLQPSEQVILTPAFPVGKSNFSIDVPEIEEEEDDRLTVKRFVQGHHFHAGIAKYTAQAQELHQAKAHTLLSLQLPAHPAFSRCILFQVFRI